MAGRATDEYRAAIRKSDLPATTRLVALVLSDFMDYRTLDDARPGLAMMVRQTRLGRSTVKEHLAELVRLEWLEVVEAGGFPKKAAVYRGVIPPQHRSSSRTYDENEPEAHRSSSRTYIGPASGPYHPTGGRPARRRSAPDAKASSPAPAEKKKSGVYNFRTGEVE